MTEYPKAEYADKILTHYIVVAIKNSGGKVDGDTYAELEGIIQDAVKEAVDIAVRKALESIPQAMLE